MAARCAAESHGPYQESLSGARRSALYCWSPSERRRKRSTRRAARGRYADDDGVPTRAATQLPAPATREGEHSCVLKEGERSRRKTAATTARPQSRRVQTAQVDSRRRETAKRTEEWGMRSARRYLLGRASEAAGHWALCAQAKKPRASSGRRDTTRCPTSGRCEGETGELRGGRGGRRTPGGRSTERENSRPMHARNSGKQAGEQKLGTCSPGRRRAQLDRAPVTRCEPVTRVGARVRVSACGRGCAAGEVVWGPTGEVCGGGSNGPVKEARRQRWASRRQGWRGNAWQSDAKETPGLEGMQAQTRWLCFVLEPGGE
ncbi:hypothetical protein ERJ75_001564900 [Trypanosoma vivax]|nr:hypothetical protein ERJ75_001564900 [Trypanosoma vivax]